MKYDLERIERIVHAAIRTTHVLCCEKYGVRFLGEKWIEDIVEEAMDMILFELEKEGAK